MERKWVSHGAGAMLTFLKLGTGVLMGIGAIVTGCLHVPKPPVFLSLLDVMTLLHFPASFLALQFSGGEIRMTWWLAMGQDHWYFGPLAVAKAVEVS